MLYSSLLYIGLNLLMLLFSCVDRLKVIITMLVSYM